MKQWYAVIGIGIFFMILSCAKMQIPVNDVKHAFARIRSGPGSNIEGVVYFDDEGNGAIRIEASVNGLSPGKHGFHIHEYGICQESDFSMAGGHFNPDGQPHAGPGAAARHVGDLGNLIADSTGHAYAELIDSQISFSGPHNILGRAVIIHAGEDDLQSQPSGNAGARIACGVIAVMNPEMRDSM
jgi:Cu-Zn family superoxide dismutase